MRLQKMIITRFRGVNQSKEIIFDDYNIIVGQNDSGKSTILKALDLFLNDSEASPDILNTSAQDNSVEIELFFLPNNKSIIIDETIPTSFEKEEIINQDGLLVIKKTWDTSKAKLTPEVLIFRKSYIGEDFLLLTENDLIKKCKTHGINTQKANGEDYNNVEKRQKLARYHQENNSLFEFIYDKLPSTGKSRGKLIADAIKKSLPRFEYFKADSPLSESDTAIQKYFKKLSETKLGEFGTEAIQTFVKEHVANVLSKITDKINQVVPGDQKVLPEVTFNWSNLVQTSFKSSSAGGNVPLRYRGDGFRRIAMMAYFEHLAEENKTEHQNIVFGFEEPETFLHPSAQEQLFEKLMGMTENGYQVFVTTHSPIIVANSNRSRIVHILKDGINYNVIQNINDFTELINDLGISTSNQFIKEFEKAKVIVLVEGPDDSIALSHAAGLYKQNGAIDKTFTDLQIVLIPIGGCDSIKHWQTLNLLQDIGKPFYIIQDSDKPNANDVSPRYSALIDLGFIEHTDFHVLKKRAIENYINTKTLERLIPGIFINYDDWTHVKNLSKQHAMAVALGGGKIAEKHFPNQSFAELQESFRTPDGNDEFMIIHGNIVNKML